MTHKILVVEDDRTLIEMLEYNLTKQGYEVVTSENGRTAVDLVRQQTFSLVLLDVMLPGLDGFEVCRLIRKNDNVPILMLTARTEEIDKIVGLEMGADDYLTKPFSMRELLARVKALIRRVELTRQDMAQEVAAQEVAAQETAGQQAEEAQESAASQAATDRATAQAAMAANILTFGNLIIDQNRREVRLDDQAIRIKPKEYELLLFLARHWGIALSRDLILERVWGWSYDGNSRTVDVHVRWLREKIEPDPEHVIRIVTVRGMGYRFEG